MEAYIIVGEEGEIVAAIDAGGFIEPLLKTALSSHHDAVDGGNVTDLKMSFQDSNYTQRWTYILDLENEGKEIKEVSLSICALYK